jgi:hypothetical protein
VAPLLLLLLHAAATLFMTGLIWFVQVSHYPLFAAVSPEAFPDYARRHQARTTLVVGPAMLIEALCAAWILLDPPAGVPWWMAAAGILLLLAIWLSTAFLQIPLHGRLAHGFDRGAIRRLVAGNWLRTIAWSVRGGLALAMIAAATRGA